MAKDKSFLQEDIRWAGLGSRSLALIHRITIFPYTEIDDRFTCLHICKRNSYLSSRAYLVPDIDHSILISAIDIKITAAILHKYDLPHSTVLPYIFYSSGRYRVNYCILSGGYHGSLELACQRLPRPFCRPEVWSFLVYRSSLFLSSCCRLGSRFGCWFGSRFRSRLLSCGDCRLYICVRAAAARDCQYFSHIEFIGVLDIVCTLERCNSSAIFFCNSGKGVTLLNCVLSCLRRNYELGSHIDLVRILYVVRFDDVRYRNPVFLGYCGEIIPFPHGISCCGHR